MTRTRSTSLYMSNVRLPTTRENLLEFLVHHFPEFFAEAHQNGTLDASIYSKPRDDVPGQNMVKGFAIIRGFTLFYEELDAAAKELNRRMQFERAGNWFNVYFKKDVGEERTADGDRVKQVTPEEAKMYAHLRGKPIRSMPLITHPSFDNNYRPAFTNRNRIGLENASIPANIIGATLILDRAIGQSKAVYASVLACFQSLVHFNNNVREPYGLIRFRNEHTGRPALIRYNHNIGVNGQFLDFETIQITNGYIPFEHFDPNVINVGHYQSMPARCIKCESEFTVLGLDKDLMWAAGKCNCDYELDIIHPRAAVHFPGETFTRLRYCAEYSDHEARAHWCVIFPPMKEWYESPEEYRQIVDPLIRWEFYEKLDSTKTFATLRVPGLKYAEYFEKSVDRDGNEINRFFVILHTNMTMFWQQSSYPDIEIIWATFMIATTHGEGSRTVIKEELRCDKFWMTDHIESGQCFLYLMVSLASNKQIERNFGATVKAQRSGNQLLEVHDYLEMWENGLDAPFLQLVLDPFKAVAVHDIRNVIFSYGGLVKRAHDRMMRELNNDQKSAIQMARSHSFSQIWGPPGTGKTLVAAAGIISMACNQRGRKLLAITPTHASSHALKYAFEKISCTHFATTPLPFQILLVSHSAQERLEIHRTFDMGPPETANVKLLHFEVQRQIRNSNDNRLLEINELKFKRGDGPIRAKDERYWSEHATRIESELLSSHPIQIWTMSAAYEERFGLWKNTHIDCCVVDEAGCIPQAFLLPVLSLQCNRIALLGDFRQLRGDVKSFSCEQSGLSISQMEWKDLCPNNISQTTLTTQYRMSPKICQLVSEYSYSSRLVCSSTVNPQLEIQLQTALALTEDEHVVVVNHHAEEQESGHGIQNPFEVNVIERIWKRLQQEGIEASRVAILTFYSAQKKLLKQSPLLNELKVELVDDMQGAESDIVLVSMVRSHDAIGFVKHQNRLTVMISRAKQLLVLVMNKWTFSSVSTRSMRELMRLLDENAVEKEEYEY